MPIPRHFPLFTSTTLAFLFHLHLPLLPISLRLPFSTLLLCTPFLTSSPSQLTASYFRSSSGQPDLPHHTTLILLPLPSLFTSFLLPIALFSISPSPP